MAKSWHETVGEHRRDVRDAIVQASWSLVHDKGPLAITMADVAERAGVSRATLYKYFASVEEILSTAHGEQVKAHLTRLDEAMAASPDPLSALTTLIEQYAEIAHVRARNGGPDLHGLLRKGSRHEDDEAKLLELFTRVISGAQATGEIRADARPEELAAYSVAALAAAGQLPRSSLPSLTATVLAGLRAH